jgi:methyltransferase (TIGR00027 family)
VSTLLIRPDRVFDGTRVLTASVLVRDGVIVEVGPDLAAPDATVVDAPGQTLLPGFVDAHTHVFPGRLEQALAFGVTTELDMFADPAGVADLRRETTARAALRSAGTGATAPGGHPCQLVDRGLVPPFPTITRPDEAARFVADRVAEGSDYLKVFLEPGTSAGRARPAPDAATVRALVAAGHAAGLLVVAHATDGGAARELVDAGVDGLVHVWVDVPAPDLVAAIAAADVFVVPTLTVIDGLWGTGEGARALAREEGVAPFLDDVSRGGLDMGGIGLGPDGPAQAGAAVAALHAAGVAILAGTDAANPGTAHGASMHQELRLLVGAGLTPAEALRAATAEPAARFRLADRGRITPGLVADLVLVAGDPARDITATVAITAIWRRGVRLERDTYAAALLPAPPQAELGDLDPLAATARWIAAERARESARPDALFTDPLAAALAGEPGRALAERMGGGGDNPTFAVRTRFFDDAITAAVGPTGRTADVARSSDGDPADLDPADAHPTTAVTTAAEGVQCVDQVVVLAAGMDARVFRLDLPADLAWYELDRPALLAVKEQELAGVTPRCERYAIGCDLADDWPAALLGAGFDPARPTVWLVEGLLAYLEADAVDRLLDRLTALSAPGSHLLCDPIGESLLVSPWMRPVLAQLAEAGTPWRFGTDRPEDLLVPRGWRPTVALMADVATRLGRWPFPRMPRDTPGVPQSFLIHAER